MKTLLLGAASAIALGAAAQAADIIEAPPYEPIPEVVPVEVGSGWYLRGDVSYDFESETSGDYRTFGACTSNCGSTLSSYATSDYDKWTIDSGVDFGVGAGYQFNDFFRGDVTAHYWSHDVSGRDSGGDACGGLCYSEEYGKATAWELMANAYVDLGNFRGLTPYIGAGIGGVHVKYDDFDSVNHDAVGNISYDTIYGNKDWRFAYAVMAGVSYDLTEALKLDVGYRYVDVDDGKIFEKNEAGGIVGGSDHGFDRHTIQAGLRYSLF